MTYDYGALFLSRSVAHHQYIQVLTDFIVWELYSLVTMSFVNIHGERGISGLKRRVRRYLQTDSVLHVYACCTSRGITSIIPGCSTYGRRVKAKTDFLPFFPFPTVQCRSTSIRGMYKWSKIVSGLVSKNKRVLQSCSDSGVYKLCMSQGRTGMEVSSMRLLTSYSIPPILVTLSSQLFHPLQFYSPSFPISSGVPPVSVVPRSRYT